MATFLRAFREFGVKETLRKLIYFKHVKFGTLKGVDDLGNKYYENTEDYILGARCGRRLGAPARLMSRMQAGTGGSSTRTTRTLMVRMCLRSGTAGCTT